MNPNLRYCDNHSTLDRPYVACDCEAEPPPEHTSDDEFEATLVHPLTDTQSLALALLRLTDRVLDLEARLHNADLEHRVANLEHSGYSRPRESP